MIKFRILPTRLDSHLHELPGMIPRLPLDGNVTVSNTDGLTRLSARPWLPFVFMWGICFNSTGCILCNSFSPKTKGSQIWDAQSLVWQQQCCTDWFQPLPWWSSTVLNPSHAWVQECRVCGSQLKWQPWSYSIILSPFIFCLFVFSPPGSLMASDTTSLRKGMTFITPFCACKWRGYLEMSPISMPGYLRQLLSPVPSEAAPRLVASADLSLRPEQKAHGWESAGRL